MVNFERMDNTNDLIIESGVVKEKMSGNKLKCVKKVGVYKIYVDFFMSLKKYYVLNTVTNEIRYGGIFNLSQLVIELTEKS